MSLLSGIVGAVTGAVSGAAKAVSSAVSNISRTASSAVRNGASLAGSAVSNTSKAVSDAVRSGTSFAGSAVSNISRTASSLVSSAAEIAKAHPAAAAAAVIAGTGAAVASTLSKSSAATATPVSIPDMSISAYYNKLTAAGDPSASSAALFMAEGREGTAEVVNREVIANTLGVSNAGSTLYKTTYHDGSYEIRDSKGQIVSSGSPGAVYAQTPEEKQKSVNAYQAKNIAKMQERANAGDVAASAWLKTYADSTNSAMYTYSAGKVWAGQTPSTTTVLYSQNGGQSTRNTQTSSQQNNDILSTISSAFDGFYQTKESMYSKAGAQLDRGDITAAAITAAPTVALDVLAPLGVMQVGNKVMSGRLDEISTDELFDAALDVGLIGLGLVTGGAGYVAGKSLKAGVKAMTKTTAKSTVAGAGMLYVDRKVM